MTIAVQHVALAVCVIAAACDAQVVDETAAGGGWRLQFSDDFDRAELGTNWQVVHGNWRIEDGSLHGDSVAAVVCSWRFSGSLRLEYDAVATEGWICDLSAMLNTNQGGGAAGGYFFGFGSDDNKFSKFTVQGVEVKRYDTRIVPGKVHHVVCQREGGRLTHSVDGQVVMTYGHENPLGGPEHDAVGLYVFGAGTLDNVKLFTKDGSATRVIAPPAPTPTGRFGFELEDPLFEELFGDTPAPKTFLNYGSLYGGGRGGAASGYAQNKRHQFRATAKRFGARYVIAELLDEAAKYNLIVYGKMSDPEFSKRSIATRSRNVEPKGGRPLIALPDDSLPYVYGTHGWLLDPRYLDYLAKEVEQRAREGDYWGIPQFDEIFTYYAIKPVPKDKWYKEVFEADKEILQRYGFGKYGMPETHENGGPFERIAHRRWASDKLTECFAKAYKLAKAVNPELKLIGPTHGSNATSADMEAWAPYFDIMGGQAGGGSSPCLLDWVRIGANTKLYVDLTGKPIHMMVHVSMHHAKQRHPEYIREMYSQVFRNGGHSVWLMNTEFFERELEDAHYAEPAKWRAMLELSQSISKMKLPRLPDPDCAILYASDSTYTTLYGGLSYHNHQDVNAYAIVGPALRSWPQFVSDRQIDRDDRDLADYKILYIPYAAYQRASVLAKVEAYVRAGGLVVCTDTNAFTWNINGEKFGERWEALAGVRKTAPRDSESVMTTVTPNPLPISTPLRLTALVPGSRIERVSDNVVNIAVFGDGSPAITMHALGQGKVIFFAADPFYTLGDGKAKQSVVALGSPIVKLIEAIQKTADVTMGHKIWRFKLPPYKTDIYQKEKDLCLTGNYVFDANEPLLEPNNLQSGGTYTYSRAPTTFTDQGKAGEPIPFTKGHLTNRLEAYKTRNRRKSRPRGESLDKITSQWIVGWDDPAPISIAFDLNARYPLSRVRLFYCGALPAVAASGSDDGNVWETLASAPQQIAGEDVKDIALGLAGEYRYLRVDFATRTAGEKFELCEVDIWGRSTK